MAKARASVGMQLVDGDELRATIEQLDRLVRHKVIDKALKAGSKPIESAMRINAPDSRKTGIRRKQSRGTRAKWSNSRPLKTTIRSVVRKGEMRSIALIGPSYSHGGGHGNFFASDHKRKVLWGQQTGKPRLVNKFVKATADQTAGAASNAMLSTIKTEIDAAAKQATRGSRG